MFKKIIVSLLLGLTFAGRVLALGVDYYLPYPGILPDHPLYWLKMVRDRIQLVLTTKPAAKAEKRLLFADKRLGAAWALIDGRKTALGVSTLTKGEKYLEQAVAAAQQPEFKQKLGKAVLKHEEVIDRLKGEVDSNYQPSLDEMLVKLALWQEQLGVAVVPTVDVSVSFGKGLQPVNKVEAATALEALTKAAAANNWQVQTKDYDFGTMVLGVGKEAYNTRYSAWIYYVNGQVGDKAADKYELKAGDKVEWRYEAVKP